MELKENNEAEKRLIQLERTAYHEAGHAVVAYVLHVGFKSISIIPNEESLGIVNINNEMYIFPGVGKLEKRIKTRLEKSIMVLLAGDAAVSYFLGKSPIDSWLEFCNANLHVYPKPDCNPAIDCETCERNKDECFRRSVDFFNAVKGCCRDLEDIYDLLIGIFGMDYKQDYAAVYLCKLREKTFNIVSLPENLLAIQRLADALLEKKKLTGKEAREIIQEAYQEYMNRL